MNVLSADRNFRRDPGGEPARRSLQYSARRIDEDALNRILWHSIKGENTPYPAPTRRALPTPFGLFTFKEEAEDK